MYKAIPILVLLIAIFHSNLFAADSVCTEVRKTLDLNKIIQEAESKGESHITIAPGDYEIDTTTVLYKKTNLTIDGTDVRLFVTKKIAAFLIEGCDTITIKGFTIDYDPIPFTQGTITKVEGGKDIYFTIHDGYPDLTEENKYVCLYVFNPETRRWKQGVADVYGDMEVIDGRHGYLRAKANQPLVKAGDLISINKRFKSCIFVSGGTQNLLMEDLTILSSPSIAIGGRFCGPNHRFNRITIAKGTKPIGATQERLVSTNADGLNYAISNSSPLVENCDFGYMGDDGINFHGPHFPIIKVESPSSFLTVRIQQKRPFKEVMSPGESLRHLDEKTYAILGDATFKSIDAIYDHDLDPLFLKKHLGTYQKEYYKNCTVYRIQTEDPVEIKVGQSMDFPALNCSGFIIRDSYFHDNRPRGLRLMSSNGLIENNRFERIRDSAINIGNEYPHWAEAGWGEHIIIRNNTLSDIGLGNVFDSRNQIPAALCVFTMNAKGVKDYHAGHSNIVIENNKFNNCQPAAIYVYGARDVTIADNVVKDSYSTNSAQAGSALSLGPRSAIDVHPKSQATLINNTISTEEL